jgi:subtilisin-like proprotein convertase family protein
LWSQVIWNRAGGRGTGSLNLTVDLSTAVAYLPPSANSTWFLRVYDGAAGDTGTITSFTITYQNQTYVSQDVPTSVYDFQTSYACIPSGIPRAKIFIQHTYIGDLKVTVGVGASPTPWSAPLWSQVIWNRTGGSTQDLNLTVSLLDAVNYLPPSQNLTWYLQVYDGATGDQGQILEFAITFQGTTYTSPDINPPVPVYDFKTSYAAISG